MSFRIGFGNDLHRLRKGKSLILGGVEIPSDFSAVGHSDADVLLHAITDAILGALALGDIGSHFSDTNLKWKDEKSLIFLNEAVRLMKSEGFLVGNLDSVITLERPKIGGFVIEMRRSIAEALETNLENVSVKVKTGEGLGAIGGSQAVKAEACILLQKA